MAQPPAGQHAHFKPSRKVRFVTAASLFDGHDATINIMRRILQATGVEVIHLGHNRSEQEIVYYEHKKHDGSYPIIGVNTLRNPKSEVPIEIELARSTEEEKQSQIKRLRDFQARNQEAAGPKLARLKQTVINNGNVFAELIDAVRVCSLG